MEGILRGRLEEARAALVARGSATEHLAACIQAATSQRRSQLQSAQFAALGGSGGGGSPSWETSRRLCRRAARRGGSPRTMRGSLNF
eukprot:6530751-Pyramimonas_sp.AAC.1